jgi:hypothetical protein
MFQYAAGLALAEQNGDRLAIDATAFEAGQARGETLRSLGVTDFGLSAPVLPVDEALRWRNPLGIVSKLGRQVSRRLLRRYFVDWHPSVMQRRGNVYLEGYFQSERYFAAIHSRVRREFTLRPELSQVTAVLRDRIASLGSSSVALHVRRGDYVSNDKTARSYNVCGPEYFRRAIERLRQQVPDARLVLFSDDVDWTLRNVPETAGALVIAHQVAADRPALRPSQELSLMAACRHAIISNSTFGWWGAYLNADRNRLVIVPDRWTNDARPRHPNIVPFGWTAVPA